VYTKKIFLASCYRQEEGLSVDIEGKNLIEAQALFMALQSMVDLEEG
jgi:hypothetical protein